MTIGVGHLSQLSEIAKHSVGIDNPTLETGYKIRVVVIYERAFITIIAVNFGSCKMSCERVVRGLHSRQHR